MITEQARHNCRVQLQLTAATHSMRAQVVAQMCASLRDGLGEGCDVPAQGADARALNQP